MKWKCLNVEAEEGVAFSYSGLSSEQHIGKLDEALLCLSPKNEDVTVASQVYAHQQTVGSWLS